MSRKEENEINQQIYIFHEKKWIDEKWVRKKMNLLFENGEISQKRFLDAETILMKIYDNWFFYIFFGKKIKKHIEKYKNHKFKF